MEKTYNEIKDLIRSFSGNYQWGGESQLLFAQFRKILMINRHGLNTIGRKYGAFNTEDRGVCLVQFNFQDLGDNGEGFPTGFNLTVNFIEDELTVGCPNAVAKLITDEKAKDFLAENAECIKKILPIGQRAREIPSNNDADFEL